MITQLASLYCIFYFKKCAKVLKNPIFAAMISAITLPRCKSIIIRQMVCHFCLTGEVLPVSEKDSNDVLITHRALNTVARHFGNGAIIDVEDCGAAYRFMMALLATTSGNWLLTGTQRLLQRPITELKETLCSIGADIRPVENGWQISGRELSAETMSIDAHRSSQFASALLLIAPRLGLRTLHLAPAEIPSSSYIYLTQALVDAKVRIPELPERELAVGRVGDWSAAVFWYAHALLHQGHEYELENLSLCSAQGDAVVADWFADMGVVSVETGTGVRISASSVRQFPPMTFDVADHLDVVPVMAALASLLPADFTFQHTRNLAYKESDRARHLAEELAPFAEIIREDDTLRVKGRSRAQWPAGPYAFQTHQDHRLAMAFLLFGHRAVLDDTSCLRKSLGNTNLCGSVIEDW